MKASQQTTFDAMSDMRERFIHLAQTLTDSFPDLDLRFNLRSGSTNVRFMVAAVSREIHELDLAAGHIQAIVQETILNIKQLVRHFDA